MNKRLLTPFIDLLFCLLLVLICIITLLKTKENNDPSFKQNVVYNIVLQWQGKSDYDLWVSDGKHITSFNRREGGMGSLMSLNRDCLGSGITETDEDGNVVTSYNEEICSVRGVVATEYIANVHLYSFRDDKPEKVTVKLIKMKPYKEIVSKELLLENNGDEKTAFRFTIDKTTEEIKDVNFLEAKIVYINQ